MSKENIVTLENPIKRGEQVIEKITLMKPNAGTLRGVSLADVARSEVDALINVLPRMTSPSLTESDVVMMDLPDLMALATKVIRYNHWRAQQTQLAEGNDAFESTSA